MLTLNASDFLRNNSITNDEDELRIALIDLSRADEVKRALEAQGYVDIVPEDDDGNLFLMATKKPVTEEQISEPEQVTPPPIESEAQPQPLPIDIPVIKNSTGVLISCEPVKYNQTFFKKVLASILASRVKPSVLALTNGAVKLAAYNTQTCNYLKALESNGVKVLISDSCSDTAGLTETVGAGVMVDMSEIFEAIFTCEKVVSI